MSSSVRVIPARSGAKPDRQDGSRPQGKRSGGGTARPAEAARTGKPGRAGKPGRGRKSAEQSRFRSLDLTGNVRMLTDQDIADLAADALERGEAWPGPQEPKGAVPPGLKAPGGEWGRPNPVGAGTWTGAATPPWSEAAPEWSSWSRSSSSTSAPSEPDARPTAPPSAASPARGLPIAGYDELSLPSLRARLRQFSVEQLDILLAHERANANRDDVVAMFERRIAKLNELDE